MGEMLLAEIGDVPTDWVVAKMDDFVERITYGFTNPMPTTESGPFMVTAKNVQDGRIVYEQTRHTSQEAFEQLLTDKSRPKTGDVLLTKDGTLGRVALVEQENLCINQSVALIRPSSGLMPLFLKHLLQAPHYQARMIADADGTTIKHIYITRVGKMQIVVPPLSEQKAIAGVLGALDDKIELNRRMNETLEEMARTIFKSWFVDFDPVRAKMEGRQPAHMDATTAALFPDRFDPDTGLPEGWEERSLSTIAEYRNGLAMQKHPPEGDKFLPVIKIAEMRKGITKKSDKASTNIPAEYIVKDGDVLFSWSGSLVVKIWTDGRGALNQHLFKVTSIEFPMWFYYLATLEHLSDFQHIAASKATTMGHIQRHHLDEALIAVPPGQVMKAAERAIEPLLARFEANALESRTLADLRDALLPKLMSGEVRVREVEKTVKAAI